MTQRLPIPGQDDNTWGEILNGFLEVSHNADGTLQTDALSQAGGELVSNKGQASGYASINSSGLVPTTQLGSGTASSGNYLRGDGTWVTPNGGSSSLAGDTDVTISSPLTSQTLIYDGSKWINQAITEGDVTSLTTDLSNRVQIGGDLGNTATAPQITSTHLSSALPINQGGTGSTSQNFVDLSTNQTIGGTKTFSSTISGNISGNAATVTTNANLTGDVTSTGNTTTVGKINGVSISGMPNVGQALVATSSAAAAWDTVAGPTGPAGPTGLNWLGSYSNSTTYAINDAVQYNGSSYINTAGTTGVNPGTPGSPNTGWSLLAEIGNTGPSGSGVAGLITPSNQGFLGWSFDPANCASSSSIFTGQIYATKITIPANTTVGCAYYIATIGSGLTTGQNLIGLYDSGGNLQAQSADCSGATYTVSTTASSATITGTGFASTMIGAQYTIAGVAGTFTVSAVGSATSLTMSTTIPTQVTSATMTPTANYSWLSATIKYTNFVSSYTSSGGTYYLGFLGVGTTVPKLETATSGLPTTLVNALHTGGAAGTGTFRSGQLGGLVSQSSLPGSLTLSSTSQLNIIYWVALY